VGGVICGLVQRPAPPQRDQVRNASAAPQRSGRRDLSAPGCRLRTSAPAKSTPVVTINALLASTRGGLDQSATLRGRHHSSYVGDGRLSGGRGVIFPDSHRVRLPCCRRQRLLWLSMPGLSQPGCGSCSRSALWPRRRASCPRCCRYWCRCGWACPAPRKTGLLHGSG